MTDQQRGWNETDATVELEKMRHQVTWTFSGQCVHEEHDEQITRKTLEMELISKLIRSLRDDEQGKSWEQRAKVVAQ